MNNSHNNWPTLPLADVVRHDKPIVYGIVQAGPECPGGVPYIKSTDVRGAFDSSSLSRTSREIADRYRRSVVTPGDIVFSLRGNIGELCIVPSELGEANLTQGTARISVNGHASNEYVAFALREPSFQRKIARLGKGSTFQEISLEALRKLEIPLPPLPEQRKIAEILRTWDEAIEKLTALRTAKQNRLHSLREKLTYFDTQGEPVRLGEVSEEVTKRNGGGLLSREMVMGVTNSRGIVPMREQTIAEDISRYKVVPPQAFAYNPMRINVGSIAMNEAEEPILVSPDYVVFACLQGRLSPDFLDHLRNTKWWSHYINSGGSGSVRQRTYYADLAAMKVPLPNFERQCRIADVLNTGRRDVEMTTLEIDALTRQKRGLMQKLLTGEWRVTVDPTTPFNPAEETHDGR